jgi:acyl-CoA thioesterase-1
MSRHSLRFNHHPRPQPEHPIGHVTDRRVVRDQQHRLVVPPVEIPQQAQDHSTCLEVEFTGGLIAQQDRRFLGQCPGDGHALLLSARQLGRKVIGTVRQPDQFEHCAGTAASVMPGQFGNQLNVLGSSERRNQIEELEDEPDLRAAIGDLLISAQPGHVDTVHHQRSGRDVVNGTGQVECRGFAGAAGTQKNGELPGGNLEVDFAQGPNRSWTLPVGLVYLFHDD